MPDELDKINEIFRIQDEHAKPAEQPAGKRTKKTPEKRRPLEAVDKLLIDASGKETRNYTGDAESERDYRPVRQSHEYRSGCLGGLMYFTFIVCVSIVLACLAWMATSDMLALNKNDFTAVVTLPSSIFQSETVDKFDEDGKKIGTKRVTHADMDYVADVLKDAGLIEYKWLFNLFCKISTADEKVSPGEYELRSTFDYRALIQNMRAGSASTVTVTVTIPEGFKMHQIFMRLEENGVCSYNDLMQDAGEAEYNYDFLELSEGKGAYRLEGFLFPDTYEFYVGMQGSSAVNKLLDDFFQCRISFDVLLRVVEMLFFHLLDFFRQKSEWESVLLSCFLENLDVCAVPCSHRQCAVHHELHVRSSRSFFSCRRNLLRDICGREYLLRDRNSVVLDEHYAEFSSDAPVVIDPFSNGVDELDDCFRPSVARCGFCAEYEGSWRRIEARVFYEPVVKVHDVENVQELSLVLVETLYLHVENRICVQEFVLLVLEVLDECFLVLLFDCDELFE